MKDQKEMTEKINFTINRADMAIEIKSIIQDNVSPGIRGAIDIYPAVGLEIIAFIESAGWKAPDTLDTEKEEIALSETLRGMLEDEDTDNWKILSETMCRKKLMEISEKARKISLRTVKIKEYFYYRDSNEHGDSIANATATSRHVSDLLNLGVNDFLKKYGS